MKTAFVDEDGSVLKEAKTYDYGTEAADIEKPTDPTKSSTAQYTYTFTGWSPEITDVTEDATYKAAYTKTVNKYKVTFVDEDGTILKAATEYAYGTKAADIAKPADPVKPADAQYTYTFAGWSPAIVRVTENTTYTATYTKTSVVHLGEPAQRVRAFVGGVAAETAGLPLIKKDRLLAIPRPTILLGSEDSADSIPEVSWETLSSQALADDPSPRFITLPESGVKFYLSPLYSEGVILDSERQAGVRGYFVSGQQDAQILVMDIATNYQDIDAYAHFVKENKGENMKFLKVNGIDCLAYTLPYVDAIHIAVITGNRHVVEFSFSSAMDRDLYPILQYMAASIQREAVG